MTNKVLSSRQGREILKAIKPIVESAGARCRIEFPKGNKGHHRIIYEYNGIEKFSILGGTPSSAFYVQHKINDTKKILRDLGAIK